ncbi:lytic murein transglycosylase B [Legionella spiritensis]|uniref:lytic murein transglycosylase B n=1 Tax=Legionella spiritensis TaxID=452 RepID=UPI000F701DC6|nr:lytic murein transglycosylase B [Legionella spiritensis]VEG90642.1 membrane bound lytic murein transglycosylase [Legionella spiritensis]
MRQFPTLFLALVTLLASHLLHADQALTQRKDVQTFINYMVREHGFSKQQLNQVMNDVQIQPQIIESMDRPYEKKTWDVYKALFLTPERLQGGLKFWRDNKETLDKAEKQYGVPANIIVAIVGVETLYGKHQGKYRVIDALSTLAFNYPKRSKFFTRELEQFLLLCREHHVQPNQYMGSYAGAMGKAQFMPSSYRNFAADFSGKSKKDLMNDNNAVIASIANYISKHGWKYRQGIAQPAQITSKKIGKINTGNKYAAYSVNQLSTAGIRPVTAAINPPPKAGVIELTTQNGREYWLAYPNFYVITRYNSSPQYALVVYLLSQQLKKEWAANDNKKKFAYS